MMDQYWVRSMILSSVVMILRSMEVRNALKMVSAMAHLMD